MVRKARSRTRATAPWWASVRAEAGELVAGFEGEADVGVAAELGEAFQAGVAALAGEQYAVQPARAGADRLLDRVQAVKNFHRTSLLLK